MNQFHEFLRYHHSSVIRKYLINVTKIFNLHLYNKVVEVLLVHALSEVVENQPVGVRGLGDHLVNLELLIMVRSYSKILKNDESSSDSGDKPGHHTIHWNIFKEIFLINYFPTEVESSGQSQDDVPEPENYKYFLVDDVHAKNTDGVKVLDGSSWTKLLEHALGHPGEDSGHGVHPVLWVNISPLQHLTAVP